MPTEVTLEIILISRIVVSQWLAFRILQITRSKHKTILVLPNRPKSTSSHKKPYPTTYLPFHFPSHLHLRLYLSLPRPLAKTLSSKESLNISSRDNDNWGNERLPKQKRNAPTNVFLRLACCYPCLHELVKSFAATHMYMPAG